MYTVCGTLQKVLTQATNRNATDWDLNFQPRWKCRQIHFASSNHHKKDNNKFKNKNNQNCRKIKLYGSLTTKDLKKTHSFRLIGRAETASQGREDAQQGGSWWKRRSHICVQINQGNNWGERQTSQPRVLSWGNKTSKPLAVKTCGV